MSARREELEARARDAENTAASRISAPVALSAAIDSAELYMQALRLASTAAERKRLDAKCKELLHKAERLKLVADGATTPGSESGHPVSARKLTTREQIIILEGSKLNGFVFKPWNKLPVKDEFELHDGQLLFSDSPALSLSDAQREVFGGWQRPKDALTLLNIDANGQDLPTEPIMAVGQGKVDLIQDLTSDCSVVASLCSGSACTERGLVKIYDSCIYPYDEKKQTVILSPNGKYVLKLYFNGCWRRVEIDDMLPTSTNGRVLYVVDRSHPGLLWPALLEKAYLKVRGGYDFPGSNSGTDLAVLTGWIPQQVFLHDSDVEPEALWTELLQNFESGRVLLTLGTGKLSRREQKQLGLAAEHDYAILDMKESNGFKEMLIKNPWADGDVWKGASRKKPHPHHQEDEHYPALPPMNDSDEMLPGSFWMNLDSIFQYYENIYINWNPAIFDNRYDQHFSWTLSQRLPLSHVLDNHPQFTVCTRANARVWVLLNRHFRTGDYTRCNSSKNGYISLYLYDQSAYRVLSSSGPRIRGPFVDSPNTLLKFEAVAGHSYTIVAVQQDLPAGKHNFTMSLFSNVDTIFQEAPSQMSRKQSLAASWTRACAGGNSDSPIFLTNPQFKIKLDKDQRVAALLKVTGPDGMPSFTSDIHVKLHIVASDGSRIRRLRLRDTVAHSGDYHRASAIVEKVLPQGLYTAICSTFEENELSKFSLDFYSDSASTITQLPSEGTGRLKITLPSPRLEPGRNKYLAPITVSRLNSVTFVARQLQRSSTSTLFKLSVEQGQGPYKTVLADSSMDDNDFLPVSTGLIIEDIHLLPAMQDPGTGGLWLVLERLAQGTENPSEVEKINVILYAEDPVEVGPWGLGDV
ncbi:hypothetical protein DV736_g4984, partial [Chaetothyriales sp. CBS 134916]